MKDERSLFFLELRVFTTTLPFEDRPAYHLKKKSNFLNLACKDKGVQNFVILAEALDVRPTLPKVMAAIFWHDLGSWLYALLKKDICYKLLRLPEVNLLFN